MSKEIALEALLIGIWATDFEDEETDICLRDIAQEASYEFELEVRAMAKKLIQDYVNEEKLRR
jgi:hypothetical protein